jgi:hypothetical protein
VEGVPIDKNALVYTLQIRQSAFVTREYIQETIERTGLRKPDLSLEGVRFEAFEEGSCLQILHRGTFDSEPESFALLDAHLAAKGLKRLSRSHREIYLSDARKTAPEALRTVLRIGVSPK